MVLLIEEAWLFSFEGGVEHFIIEIGLIVICELRVKAISLRLSA
jgi:hypothetical protein